MTLFDLIFIAIGLAMDAFAVSITNSLNNNNKKLLVISTMIFGIFQTLMPLIGYTVGTVFTSHVSKYSNIIGFILLLGIGINSIYENYKNRSNEKIKSKSGLSFSIILLQAIATSIDALAVGVSFAVLNVNIISSSIYIGLITTLVCLLGIWLGRIFGNILGSKSEIFGGVILIIVGVKILLG